jgi:hypothetical protein
VEGEVALATKLVCPSRDVSMAIHVRPNCPNVGNPSGAPLGIRALRIFDPLPEGIELTSPDGATGTSDQSPAAWVVQFSAAERLAATRGISLTYEIRATRPGSFAIGTGARVEVEDEAGRLSSGALSPATLVVSDACPPTRTERRLFLPLVQSPLCPPSAAPIDLVLAIDRSSGMGPDGRVAAANAARTLLAQLRPTRDRVAVLTFAHAVRRPVPLGADLAAAERALDTLLPAPGTRIDRVLREAVAELDAHRTPGRRRVIALLSDGIQTGPDGSTEVLAAASEARERGIVIMTVAVGLRPDHTLLRAISGDPTRSVSAPERVHAPEGVGPTRDGLDPALCLPHP